MSLQVLLSSKFLGTEPTAEGSLVLYMTGRMIMCALIFTNQLLSGLFDRIWSASFPRGHCEMSCSDVKVEVKKRLDIDRYRLVMDIRLTTS
jgi:hypothetical protein